MLSALGPSFGTSFAATWSALGHELGPYVLLTVGLVLAIVVVGFILHFVRRHLEGSEYYNDALYEDTMRGSGEHAELYHRLYD